jgi:hypothetical protein
VARGWESKGVEDQVAEAEAAREALARPTLTPEERERRQREASLRLTRARLLESIDAARDARHRELLERSLAHIDGELAALGGE